MRKLYRLQCPIHRYVTVLLDTRCKCYGLQKRFNVLVLPLRVLDMASKKLNNFHVEINMTMTTCNSDEISVSNDKKENDKSKESLILSELSGHTSSLK